ncbi:MAG: hypothetical protein OQJ89_00105 [Kangiellaceae bacterium]|nr:hypothetical protein [Kangiellaceae bacterium]MCW9000997.1 hypothetical protein [Kangiellaceae bacterium]MCW9015340.1 hypothetical protein [Kangiellaceae bacterium]
MYLDELGKKLEEHLVPQLNELGYKYLGVKDVSTEAIPQWFKGSFENTKVGRIVEVGYIPAGEGTKEVLKCHVTNINFEADEFDYSSTNQMTVPSIKISELNLNFSERLATSLDSVSVELNENFKNVLLGKHFESELMNWQGLK